MNIAINAFVTFLLSISIHTSGQGVAAYIDKYDRFKIYDNGVEKQIEYLEIQSHKFGPGYVAYVDNAGEFKVYYRGKAQSLNINRPHFYQPTNNLLVYWDTKILRVLDNNKLQSFPNVLMGDFVFGDSVLGIIDRLDYFHAYYQGRFWEIDQRPITAMAAGDNMLVYVDEADEMVIFKHGETEVAETEPPIYFEAGCNIVAYIDAYRDLKIYYRGETHKVAQFVEVKGKSDQGGTVYLDEIPLKAALENRIIVPGKGHLRQFQTGDDLVAFIDDFESFKVFDKGEIHDLLDYAPKRYIVEDRMVAFADVDDKFKVYYNGTVETLEIYIPEKYKLDQNVLAYTDFDGRLKAFHQGNVVDISESIVENFYVNGNVIAYTESMGQWKFFEF